MGTKTIAAPAARKRGRVWEEFTRAMPAATPSGPQHDPLAAIGGQDALAAMLAPALREACGGRLSSIAWFRADWQRGGAATGYAGYRVDGEASPREVVVKVPVGPTEYRVATALGASADAPTPRIAAHGLSLGGYDLAWLVMERLPGDPLSASLHHEVFEELARACAGFQRACEAAWPSRADGPAGVHEPDWGALLETSRHAVKDSRIPHASEWNDAIKHAQRALPRILPVWAARPMNAWRHGDLHPGNAMRRPEGSPWGPARCVLLDFAEVQPGHWVEDAVYLERMHWGRHTRDGKNALEGVKTVSLLAKARKAEGLACDGDYATLANIRRTLTAASVPAFLDREGTASHLQAALETLRRLLPMVAK